MSKSTPTRYGSTARLIHWVSAGLVLVLLVTGFRSGFSEDAATKTAALRIHVPVAIALLVLTIWRILWWWRFDRKPDPAGTGPAWQETLARWTHRALYLLLIVMLASGIAISVLSGLPLALFGDAPLPDFATLPPRDGHGAGARAIAALVALHAGAALYHHLVLRDDVLRRMWDGRG